MSLILGMEVGMAQSKGWLSAQMQSAKKEVSNWQNWKKDTIRKEIVGRLSNDSRGVTIAARSATGQFVIKEGKK
jgi:hypothetical protein